MGRGRAKAKQTKVARDLKYRSYSTDFVSLERELRGGDTYDPLSAASTVPVDEVDEVEEDDEDDELEDDEPGDQYADLASRYADFGPEDEIRRIG